MLRAVNFPVYLRGGEHDFASKAGPHTFSVSLPASAVKRAGCTAVCLLWAVPFLRVEPPTIEGCEL